MEQQIYLIGLNYRTAGVEVRERFALTDHCSKDTWAIPLRPSGENDSAETTLDEALILSTCNRVEILAVGQGDVPGLILEAWASAKNRKAVELAPYVYIHKGREAIAHLFTVASSLDSMVLGEPQILGQLKGAYRKATLAGTTKTIINRLLHKSFSVAKRVRTETGIAASAVSISYAAVELAKRVRTETGIAEGCKQAGCALLGGETAEMPDMYADGEYDLAGFCVGMADNAKIVDGSGIRVGDVLIGLASSGIHSNGYSLVRKILDKSGLGPDDTMPGSDRTVKDVLLEPTYIYSDVVRNLMRDLPVKGMVHITGGGFYDNIPRVLPNSVTADIKFASWDVQPVFHWLREEGGLTWPEMLQIFNCGIGYVFIVPSEVAEEAMGRLEAMHKGAWVIGTIGRRQDKDEEQVKILF